MRSNGHSVASQCDESIHESDQEVVDAMDRTRGGDITEEEEKEIGRKQFYQRSRSRSNGRSQYGVYSNYASSEAEGTNNQKQQPQIQPKLPSLIAAAQVPLPAKPPVSYQPPPSQPPRPSRQPPPSQQPPQSQPPSQSYHRPPSLRSQHPQQPPPQSYHRPPLPQSQYQPQPLSQYRFQSQSRFEPQFRRYDDSYENDNVSEADSYADRVRRGNYRGRGRGVCNERGRGGYRGRGYNGYRGKGYYGYHGRGYGGYRGRSYNSFRGRNYENFGARPYFRATAPAGGPGGLSRAMDSGLNARDQDNISNNDGRNNGAGAFNPNDGSGSYCDGNNNVHQHGRLNMDFSQGQLNDGKTGEKFQVNIRKTELELPFQRQMDEIIEEVMKKEKEVGKHIGRMKKETVRNLLNQGRIYCLNLAGFQSMSDLGLRRTCYNYGFLGNLSNFCRYETDDSCWRCGEKNVRQGDQKIGHYAKDCTVGHFDYSGKLFRFLMELIMEKREDYYGILRFMKE